MKAALLVTQLAIAISIFNVWLLRRQVPSPWRGGSARTLDEEFAAYGLPAWAVTVVGGAKVTCAALLLIGIFYADLARPAAFGLSLLLLAAVAMHMRVADPLRKSLPAAALLLLTMAVALAPVN